MESCVWKRERRRERGRKIESEKERERASQKNHCGILTIAIKNKFIKISSAWLLTNILMYLKLCELSICIFYRKY